MCTRNPTFDSAGPFFLTLTASPSMDIRSLLSEQDAPAHPSNGASSQSNSPVPRPAPAPRPKPRNRGPSLVQQAVTTSTQQQMQASHDTPVHTLPGSVSLPPQPLNRNAYSGSAVDSRSYYASAQLQSQPTMVQRHSSSSMDTLAGKAHQLSAKTSPASADFTFSDLATMQHYQHTVRQNSISVRNPDLISPQRSPSSPASRIHSDLAGASTPSALRKASVAGEHPMTDGPVAVLAPRSFEAPSLSSTDLQALTDLTKSLAENSYNYAAHTQLIALLHHGFIAHIFQDDSIQDPNTYPLLGDLRHARAAMDSRFACGEDISLAWLKDEIMASRSIEQRIAAVELCQKAIREEVGSAPLWRLYGDWMFFLHKTASGLESNYETSSLENDERIGRVLQTHTWSDEDKLIGAEVFGWDQMLNVWQQGVLATSWHIPDSHLVWDPYMEILLDNLRTQPSPEKVAHIRRLFWERLHQPHISWDNTFQTFSQFVSTYDSAAYEETMVNTKTTCEPTLSAMAVRQDTESKLTRAINAADKEAEWTIMSEYLEWEFAVHRHKKAPPFSFDLLISLCQRCNLRFPIDADFWEDYLDLLAERPVGDISSIDVSYRATRHVPWSGNLWSRRIYCLEAANKAFDELEGVKHMATSTGLLEEVGSMDELIKVYSAWCGYLRRRAFGPSAGEDERDIAEVAIRSAIENVKSVGMKRYGKDFKGDPRFRIERIYFKFLGQTGAYDEARKFWADMAQTHGDQYEFWERYYLWEMVIWSKEAALARRDHILESPEHATAVLLQAVRRPNLDWPEKMIEQYLHHCSQHESVAKVEAAMIIARRATKELTKRRAAQAAQTATVQQAAATEQAHASESHGLSQESQSGAGKRKRSDAQPEESKRVKSEASDCGTSAEPTRDREHTTIIVRRLPSNTEESQVRQFFRDCGKILSLTIVPEQNDSTATVEFESKQDVLTAQTKAMKPFQGQSIEIHVGTGSTLYVTNYPPEADEEYIRGLFSPFGEIVGVRFPSLRFNTHRRFCYVQFADAHHANSALELDGKSLPKGLKLIVKVSDPNRKQDRSGAMEEGREVFVGQYDYKATESDAEGLFGTYGSIEEVRIPRDMDGSSKGIAFVAFSTKEAAESALQMNLKEFRGRILQVRLSGKQGAKLHSTTKIRPSATPDPEKLPDADASSTGKDYRSRSFALIGVPDTVNDARIRVLCEAHGTLKKIVLMPDHQGAIVEFQNQADVGKASLALDSFEIMPGKFLRVGEVWEMKKNKAENRDSRNGVGAANKPKMLGSAPVSRPGQVNGRGGRRGGLGFKRAGAQVGPKQNGDSSTVAANGDADTGGNSGKSQDDFRAMLEKK